MPKVTQIHIAGRDVLVVDEHKPSDESNYDHKVYVEAISTPIYSHTVEQDIKGTIRI